MKLHVLFLLPILGITAAAQKSPAPVETGELVEMEFQTSPRKQLSKPGVLAAFQSAVSIEVQLISSPDDQNAVDCGKILESVLRSESAKKTLTAEERKLLLDVLSEDTTYKESLATCGCYFTPQLRVTFEDPTSKKHYDIFISGVSHGEIQAIEAGHLLAFTTSGSFIPRYLLFMDRLYPQHSITEMLHEYDKQRMKSRANQALQHNDPSCHAPCMRTCRASRGRG